MLDITDLAKDENRVLHKSFKSHLKDQHWISMLVEAGFSWWTSVFCGQMTSMAFLEKLLVRKVLGPFLKLFLLAVSILHAIYAPQAPHVSAVCCASRFCRSALSAWSWKKATLSRKTSDRHSCVFFRCPFKWMERRAFRCGDESLPLLRKSRDCNDWGETFSVCHGLPGD